MPTRPGHRARRELEVRRAPGREGKQLAHVRSVRRGHIGFSGELPGSESRRSSLPWHTPAPCAWEKVPPVPSRPERDRFSSSIRTSYPIRSSHEFRESRVVPMGGIGSAVRMDEPSLPAPAVADARASVWQASHSCRWFPGSTSYRAPAGRKGPGDGTWLPSAETRRGSVRTGSARPHERRAPGEWNADRIGATRGSGTSGSP